MRKLLFALLITSFPLVCKAEVEVYPANQKDDHFIGKCDSDAVKKRAHRWGFMAHQKAQDVTMQTRCYETCERLALLDASQAVNCIRECNDQQREQRGQGVGAFQGALGLLGLGAALLK